MTLLVESLCVEGTDSAGKLLALVLQLMCAVYVDMVVCMHVNSAVSAITCIGGTGCAGKLIALVIQPM